VVNHRADHRELLILISPALGPLLRSGEVYDPATALAMAEHAHAVYSATDEYWEACRRGGYREAVTVLAGATQIGVAIAEWGVVVSARGSSERLDWLDNASAWRVRWPEMLPQGAAVHHGFLRQVRRMRERLRSRLDAALGSSAVGMPMFVTGHSLGGAIAPLVALCLAHDLGLKLAAAYLFESPRAGNREWSAWWNGQHGRRTHRVVVVRRGVADLVTRVPPSSCGWWHIGRPQMIRDGYRYESEEEWELARANHPVRAMSAWRVLSRLGCAVQAHSAGDLVTDLAGIRARLMEAAPAAAGKV
jgi:hypothetical protein